MIITKETEYAARMLRSLLRLGEGEIKNIRIISDEQAVPRQFAYKISKKMERAGFIKIVHGAHGGCRIDRDLRDITMMEFIRTMDKENMTSYCLHGQTDCLYREQAGECSIRDSLCYIQRDLAAYFSTITVQQFVTGQWPDAESK